MGSGGMIVMDQGSCMVDVAKFFMDFCRDESCGKCLPCRAGTVQMYNLLDRITRGVATGDDLARLERLADLVRNTSLCGLGQGAPNPVSATLRYFRSEYLAHIDDHVLPGRYLPDGTGPCWGPAGIGGPMSVLTLVIDGQDVAGPSGQSIWQAAAENGIVIPALCHLDGLSEVGACRLCVVEVAGPGQAGASMRNRHRGGHERCHQLRDAPGLPAADH